MVLDVSTLIRPMHVSTDDLRIDAAALYTRVSTIDQARGYGRAAQLSNIGRYAERDGSIRILDNEYNDDAVSGTKVSRAGIDKLLKDAADGKIDLVIVDKLDRLGRSNIAIYRVVERLKELGIPLVCVANNIDTREGGSKHSMPFIAAMAEVEHALILERTQGGKQEKAKENGWVGGEPPYGYRIEGIGKRGSYLVIDEHEAKILLLAVHMLVDEMLSYAEIAKRLNARGLFPRKAAKWTRGNIRQRLSSTSLVFHTVVFRQVIGPGATSSKTKVDRHGNPLHGESVLLTLPDILENPERPTLGDELLRALGMGPDSTKRRQRPSQAYPLSKRLYGVCGKHYTGNYSTSRNERMYRCSGMDNGGACGDPYLPAAEVEQLVMNELVGFIGDPRRLRAIVEAWLSKLPETRRDFEDRVTRHEENVAALQTELVGMVSSFKGVVDPKIIQAAAAQKQAELTEAEKHLNYAREWLAEYENRETSAHNAVALAETAVRNMKAIGAKEFHDLAGLLNLKVTLDPGTYEPRHGRACRTRSWHIGNNVAVPRDIGDEDWHDVVDILLEINGPQHMRRGTDYRNQINALLYRLRNDVQWEEMPEEFGTRTALRNRQLLWFKNGTWAAVVAYLLTKGPGTSLAKNRLPSFKITGGFDYARIKREGLTNPVANLREEAPDSGELCFELQV